MRGGACAPKLVPTHTAKACNHVPRSTGNRARNWRTSTRNAFHFYHAQFKTAEHAARQAQIGLWALETCNGERAAADAILAVARTTPTAAPEATPLPPSFGKCRTKPNFVMQRGHDDYVDPTAEIPQHCVEFGGGRGAACVHGWRSVMPIWRMIVPPSRRDAALASHCSTPAGQGQR